MAKIAILGFGTVGAGVYELTADRVKRVLDIRDFEEQQIQNMLTRNFADILNDSEIDIVVETMGGLNPAYDYVKRSLAAGKSVVSSNKELVAVHCAELTQIAKLNNVSFLYEASVGGGITIIRTLRQLRYVDKITEITGILNGTTNYILTRMTDHGDSFDEALAQAKRLGYAEANPAADIEGHDSCRKIAILASLVTEKHVDFSHIPVRGIADVTKEDIVEAKKSGFVIKLIAGVAINTDGITAYVEPVLVPMGHPLSAVSDSENAIYVKYANIGVYMFQGRGAGKFPTAGAIVSNIIDIESIAGHISCGWSTEQAELLIEAAHAGKLRKWV